MTALVSLAGLERLIPFREDGEEKEAFFHRKVGSWSSAAESTKVRMLHPHKRMQDAAS